MSDPNTPKQPELTPISFPLIRNPNKPQRRSKKRKKPHADLIATVDCLCGTKVQLFISRGEASTIFNSLCKNRIPPITLRYRILAPTGKHKPDGSPEFAVFDRNSLQNQPSPQETPK